MPGRFEAVDAGQPFTVLVDYAHKPDALDQALSAARELVAGSGPADGRVRLRRRPGPGQAPVMGEVAAGSPTDVVVTSDNPRPRTRRRSSTRSWRASPPVPRVASRSTAARAIERALAAPPGATSSSIAGKGHETTQVVGDQSFPFDDRGGAEALARPRAVDGTWGPRPAKA